MHVFYIYNINNEMILGVHLSHSYGYHDPLFSMFT